MSGLDWLLLAGLLALLGLAARARPEALVAGCFVYVTVVWRMIAATAVDAHGPFWSSQLERHVGGDGGGAVYTIAWAMTGLLAMLPFAARRPVWRFAPPPPLGPGPTLGNLAFAGALLFVAALFADMLQRGVVPLLVGMERYDYARDHAGPLHAWLFEYGGMFAFALGLFCVMRLRAEGRLDLRFVGLLGALYAYALLTGHRVSAFYLFGTYFAMPFAALPLSARRGEPLLPRLPARQQRMLSGPALAAVGTLAAATAAAALLNSYLNVRAGDEDALSKIVERIAVQPVEMWWPTWERVFVQRGDDPSLALRAMFVDPVDGSRNTGIQYLMLMILGETRTQEIVVQQGMQFAGGYPEVLFEVFGPGLGWVVLAGASLLYGLALRRIADAVLDGHVLTALLGTYVLFTAALLFIGGMMNWIVAWTFWVKLAAFLGASAFESAWHARRGVPPVPWTFKRRALAAELR